jgi:hypothetical protein
MLGDITELARSSPFEVGIAKRFLFQKAHGFSEPFHI